MVHIEGDADSRRRVAQVQYHQPGYMSDVLRMGDRVVVYQTWTHAEVSRVVQKLHWDTGRTFALMDDGLWWDSVYITAPLPPPHLEQYEEWQQRYAQYL